MDTCHRLPQLLTQGAARSTSAGDSRAVLCSRSSARRLTEDHKPDLPRERSRVEQQGGRVEYQRCWRVVVEPRDGRPGSGLAVSRWVVGVGSVMVHEA
jgi:serine/threonine protein phosphatase PrpC